MGKQETRNMGKYMEENEVGKLTIEMSPELKKQYKKICVEDDISMQAQTEELIRGHVGRKQKVSRNI